MRNKKGRIATLLFIGLMILPLLGLLIMDYQLKRANDLTGRYILEGSSAYATENMTATIIILAVFSVLVLSILATKIRDSRMVKTHDLSKINDDIKKIEKRLKSI